MSRTEPVRTAAALAWLDGQRVYPGAGQQRRDDARAEIGRVHTGQAAAAPADRGPDGVDQERLGHGHSPRPRFPGGTPPAALARLHWLEHVLF
jgi:hypothetical protein